MTLLDRFRTQPPQKHPDATIRLAYVQELPLSERQAIAVMAREDEDPRVRKAAVAKLMDPSTLAAIAGADRDEGVRVQAATMLRDIAVEAFEEVGEHESLEAVEAISDPRGLSHVAKTAAREITALRALSRIDDARLLGSIARHAAVEAARRGAFESLVARGERPELMAVAMNGDFKDTALAALELFTEKAELEQIANRGKNKAAAKRARAIVREMEEGSVDATRAAGDASEPVEPAAPDTVSATATPPQGDILPIEAPGSQPEPGAERREAQAESALVAESHEEEARAAAERHAAERLAAEQAAAEREIAERAAIERAAEQAASEREAADAEASRRRARLAELADEAAAATEDADLASARKRFALVRREWRDLSAGLEIDSELTSRFTAADALITARDAEAREAEARARREALARLHNLLGRVEPLAARSDLSLKAADRAVRDVRTALSSLPMLPTRQDHDDVLHRLKAVQAALTPKVQELREADEWRRFANVAIQERLCAQMEGLQQLEDPEAIARHVRELQQQWREAADVPRAQADALWRRFKAAHDAVWPRVEAHFANQAGERAENLAKKVALCERAEALADSTNWIQTADEIKQLQAEWKTVGAVSRGKEKAIWDRFRSACDRFFTRRHEDLAHRKVVWAENLAKKEALCGRAEALAQSTDWDQAAAEIKHLQAEWKTVGPVKKSRSEAIWQRFRAACDTFFARYAQRHDTARGERIAAREAICAELEALSPTDAEAAPADLLARVRSIRSRWQQEVAGRGVDPEHARALDERFNGALARLTARWPETFGGSEFDPESNRKRMETLVKRMEDLAASLAGPAAAAEADSSLSPTTRLAAMLKEALAANTIGGKVDDDSRFRAATEEARQAQAAWSRLGVVPDEARRPLQDRFQKAIRRISERTARSAGSRGSSRRGSSPA